MLAIVHYICLAIQTTDIYVWLQFWPHRQWWWWWWGGGSKIIKVESKLDKHFALKGECPQEGVEQIRLP